MDKITRILDYYKLTTSLKETIRSGWKYWNVKRERLESVAEHVYGACMLAVAIWSESNADIDICRVIMMLALHETEETIIGDLTPYDQGYDIKNIQGHEAVAKVFEGMAQKDFCVNLIKEFDEGKTKDAKFAFKIDKLECDLQIKRYDEQGCVTIEGANELVKSSALMQDMIKSGAKTPAECFILTDKRHFDKDGEDDIFYQINKYLQNHKIYS